MKNCFAILFHNYFHFIVSRAKSQSPFTQKNHKTRRLFVIICESVRI